MIPAVPVRVFVKEEREEKHGFKALWRDIFKKILNLTKETRGGAEVDGESGEQADLSIKNISIASELDNHFQNHHQDTDEKLNKLFRRIFQENSLF